MPSELLSVENLRTYFFTEAGIVKAIDGMSLHVLPGETLGLIGESGSGKTMTAMSVLRIVPQPGKILDGNITFAGENLLDKSEKEMMKIRGAKIAISFQDPSSSLTPVHTVGSQIMEIIRRHEKISKEEATERTIELLDKVGIPDPETRVSSYPHELSGGMKQRIALARAISCNPTLIFLDEPTTNVDVTIQAQILELLGDLKKRTKMSMVFISHDMGVIAQMSDRVTIMYAGRVCETADVEDLYKDPRHPYTEALLTAIPRVERAKGDLSVIPGSIPNLIEPPSGCRFHPRCKYAIAVCKEKIPVLEDIGDRRCYACWRADELSLTSPIGKE